MARKKDKHRRSGKDRMTPAVTAGAVAGALTDLLGNAIGQWITDGLERYLHQNGKGGSKRRDPHKHRDRDDAGRDDVAAALLRRLMDKGPQSLPDLLSATDAGLTPVLRALRQLQRFQLIETDPDTHALRLTDTGGRTADTLKAGQIRRDAARSLPE